MDKFPRICILGGGFSGICAGIRIKTELGLENFTIFEENEEFGGTWLLHKYPGCASDIAAHLYSFSFELNPDWSQMYCGHAEILAYLQRIAAKHDLYSRTKFHHQVQKLTWSKKSRTWTVFTVHTETKEIKEWMFDMVIAGPGPQRVPEIPEIFKDFQGPLIHPSKWPSSLNLTDKVVAVIGSGSSAVQVVPGIVKDVKKLYSFQRRPPHVCPKPQGNFSPRIRKVFATVPWIMRFFRTLIFLLHELVFPSWKHNSKRQAQAEWVCSQNRKRGISKNSELVQKLQPNYRFGCQHPCFSSEFYPALAQNHVDVVREPISEVNHDGILTEDRTKRVVDIIIVATGYKQLGEAFFHPTQLYVVSESGEETQITNFGMKEGQFYLGVMTPVFPNLFLILGPNSTAQHNSAIFSMECQVNWIIAVIRRMVHDEAKMVSVKQDAVVEYNAKLQEGMKSMAFGGDVKCNSWFLDKSTGLNNISLASSCIGFWRSSRKVVWQDLEFCKM